MSKTIVKIEHKEPIHDKSATANCPKYNFNHVEIATVCAAGCEHFKGIQKVAEGEWHDSNFVLCAFPLQRRIHRPQIVIRGAK